MTILLESIHKLENYLYIKKERFIGQHPCLMFLALFIGMPVFILFAVAASVMLIMFPLSLLLGWI